METKQYLRIQVSEDYYLVGDGIEKNEEIFKIDKKILTKIPNSSKNILGIYPIFEKIMPIIDLSEFLEKKSFNSYHQNLKQKLKRFQDIHKEKKDDLEKKISSFEFANTIEHNSCDFTKFILEEKKTGSIFGKRLFELLYDKHENFHDLMFKYNVALKEENERFDIYFSEIEDFEKFNGKYLQNFDEILTFLEKKENPLFKIYKNSLLKSKDYLEEYYLNNPIFDELNSNIDLLSSKIDIFEGFVNIVYPKDNNSDPVLIRYDNFPQIVDIYKTEKNKNDDPKCPLIGTQQKKVDSETIEISYPIIDLDSLFNEKFF